MFSEKIFTRSKVQKNINGTVYKENGGFSRGILPTQKEIVENMVYLLRSDRAGKVQRTVEEASRLLAYALIQHWEHCKGPSPNCG